MCVHMHVQTEKREVGGQRHERRWKQTQKRTKGLSGREREETETQEKRLRIPGESESREKDPGRWQAQHLASGTADPRLVVPQGPFQLLS